MVLSLDIALQPLWALAADGAVASTAANAATQVTQAHNGVEVIQIADPNAAGVSHNLFQDYQVGPQGQVLNNSATDVRSKLAGTIEGNSQLQHGSARIILNEVTGANPSSLLGVTEVAGQAASLVIANPNGITCSGCGFLNTPRVTLGTGRSLWQDGQLTGLTVDQGTLEIGQEGLLGGNLERLELLAKQIVLYGQVVSSDLTLGAGSLQFNFADGSIQKRNAQAGTTSLPQFAIDASALGGMYANKIALVATDNGVGVNVEGPMAAYNGSIRIDANGEVRVNDVQSQQALKVETQGKVTLDKALATEIDVRTPDAVQVNGTLAAQEQLSVQAKSIKSQGTVSAGYRADGTSNSAASLSLITTDKADNQGQWLSAGSLSINAGDLTNRLGAMISGREGLSLTASAGSNRGELNSLGALTLTIDGLWDNRSGRVQTAGQLTLNAETWDNRTGHLQGAVITADLDLNLNNAQGEVVTPSGDLQLNAADLNNQQGVLQSQAAVRLTADTLDNTQGTLAAKGGEISRLALTQTLTNGGGNLTSASGTTEISAKTLDQTAKATGLAGGVIEFTGSGNHQITADQINNQGGQINNRGASLAIKAQDLHNQNGTLRSGQKTDTTSATSATQLTLNVSGALDNQQGRVLSDSLSLTAGSLDNSNGYIDAQSTQGKTLIALTGDAQNGQGTLLSRQNELDITTANWQNNQGQIGHLGSGLFRLQAQQMDNSAGKVQTFGSADWQLTGWNNAQGKVSIRGDGAVGSSIVLSGDWLNDQGRLLVGDDGFTFTARQLINTSQDDTQGIWHSGNGHWTLKADTFTNRAGTVGGAGGLQFELQHLENAGQIDGQTLHLTAQSVANAGVINLSDRAATSLDSQIQGDWLNQGGKISLAGGGVFAAAHWDNTQGQLLAAGAISVTASGGDADKVSFLNAQGWLQADMGLALTTANTLDNRQGTLLSGGTIQLTSQAGINNTSGTIDLTPSNIPGALTPTVSISAAGEFDNTQGVVQSFSHGSQTLSTSQINNTQGLIYSQAQSFTAMVAQVDNTGGRWQHTGQTLEIKGLKEWRNAANTSSAALMQTDGTLVIQGFERILNSGQVGEAPSTIRARSAQLQGKRLENLSGAQLALVAPDSSSALDITEAETAGIPKPLASLAPVDSSLQLDQLVNQGGIFTQSNLDLGKAHLLNTGGQLSSLNDLTLSAADLGTLGGTLWAEGTLTLTSEGDFTFANQAKLDAGRGIVWDVKGAFTNQGSLASGSDLTLKAASFNNSQTSDVSAVGALALELTQSLTNQGRIRGASDTQVQANSIANNGLIASQKALNLSATATLTNTDTLFATGDLTALAPELFNTSSAATTASIWAGGKLTLAGGKTTTGGRLSVGKQLINTSGSIQTYRSGDIELAFNQLTNRTNELRLKSEPTSAKVWFTTGSGKPDADIGNGEFDLTVNELVNLLARSGNQLPYTKHNLYVYQPAVPITQPRINSGGALRIQTQNEFTATQGSCSGDACTPGAIQNIGGAIQAARDITIDLGYRQQGASAQPSGSLLNGNIYLPGEATHERKVFTSITPDPGVSGTETAKFSIIGTFSYGSGISVSPETVEKAASLFTGSILAGGSLTTYSQSITNEGAAAYQAAWTGHTPGDAPTMSFSQAAPFSRIPLSATSVAPVGSTERTALSPVNPNAQGLVGDGASEVTTPERPQTTPVAQLEARIYNPLQNLVLPNNGYLYRVDIKGSSPYVVQAADLIKPPTDKPATPPTSSDYFFTQLGYDPEQIGRRLGDSFYETELVRQAVMNTRGVRFVTDPRTGLAIDSDEAQYRYLLDNALEAQKDLQLAVGTALTPEQVRALTQDIVWLERHELAEQEVWVPVYYATGVDPNQMANGAVMAGQS
ncbi:MAG TPA: filamentous hemagglutinin N-terminal domain-containing protein, partial [Cellvibrionaceae bacterium]|nr:filamentous hemagglutinin N-terminal domain-containing protein [Cellvibrionaceae bacterium]